MDRRTFLAATAGAGLAGAVDGFAAVARAGEPMNADDIHAFVPDGRIERAGSAEGPLAGKTFGLKDVFDLAGVPTGAGNPDWLASHETPTRTAPAAQRLLDAGGRLIGKTITDEIAWSLNGENAHYGTPVNVAAAGRIPGGSSAGSAAATAAGLCDVALGTDTGGSVRLPASYCGLYGLRPTHGRVPIDGVVPLAASYDTVGWLARDPQMLDLAGRVLLGSPQEPAPTERLLIADDLFERAEPQTRAALQPALKQLAERVGRVEHVTVAGEALAAWRETFRIVQSSEAWAAHGAWVSRAKPSFGPGVKQRFEAAARLDPGEVAKAVAMRAEIRARMEALVPAGSLLILPTVPGIAPRLKTPEPDLNVFRARALEMLCPAGHAGMPQVSMPLGTVEGCPVGLSALGARGQDEALLDLAIRSSKTAPI